MRVAVVVLGVQPDLLHAAPARARLRSLALARDAVDRERLADDRADRLARVERRVRVLEDHLHLAPQRAQLRARRGAMSLAVEARSRRDVGSSRRSQQARGRRLAAARLADEPERLARGDVERHAVDGVHGADLRLRTTPRVIGKCLTRSRDLDERAAHATPSPRARRRERGQRARSATARSSRPSARPALASRQATACSRVARARLELRLDRAGGHRGRTGSAGGSGSRSDGRSGSAGGRGSGRARSSRGRVEPRDRPSRPHVYGCSGAAKSVASSAPARRSCPRT